MSYPTKSPTHKIVCEKNEHVLYEAGVKFFLVVLVLGPFYNLEDCFHYDHECTLGNWFKFTPRLFMYKWSFKALKLNSKHPKLIFMWRFFHAAFSGWAPNILKNPVVTNKCPMCVMLWSILWGIIHSTNPDTTHNN